MIHTMTDVDGGIYETPILHQEFTAMTQAGITVTLQPSQKQISLIKTVT